MKQEDGKPSKPPYKPFTKPEARNINLHEVSVAVYLAFHEHFVEKTTIGDGKPVAAPGPPSSPGLPSAIIPRLSWDSRGANGQTDRRVEVRMVKIPERWLYSSLSPLLRLVVVGVVVTAISHIKYPYYYHYYSYHHKSNGLSDPELWSEARKRDRHEVTGGTPLLLLLAHWTGSDNFWTTWSREAKFDELLEHTKTETRLKFGWNWTRIDGDITERISEWIKAPVGPILQIQELLKYKEFKKFV